jgi:hypothetical protein
MGKPSRNVCATGMHAIRMKHITNPMTMSVGLSVWLTEKIRQSAQNSVFVRFTLPHDNGRPTPARQRFDRSRIARSVFRNLRQPILLSAKRRTTRSTVVAVPEAAVDENGLLASRKRDVGRARKRSNVQPVAVTESVQKTSDAHFGSRVLAPNGLHIRTSGFRRQSVHSLSNSARLNPVPVCYAINAAFRASHMPARSSPEATNTARSAGAAGTAETPVGTTRMAFTVRPSIEPPQKS